MAERAGEAVTADCGQSGPCAARAPGCARHFMERIGELNAEVSRLRRLFDDAGQGEHNVLALIENYQRNSMEADERLRAVRKLLEEHGCGCPCDHHWTEHEADCERCLGCLVANAIAGPLLCVVDLDVLRQQRDELSVEVNRLRRLESSLPASLRDAHAEVEQLRATLADARAAVGETWFAGGATLAEAITRKCRRLEELGERVERVLEQGWHFTDRHMQAAADLVVKEVREALAEPAPETCDDCGAIVGGNPACGACCDWARADARKGRP